MKTLSPPSITRPQLAPVKVYIDADVLAWLRTAAPGHMSYTVRTVLRRYMDECKAQESSHEQAGVYSNGDTCVDRRTLTPEVVGHRPTCPVSQPGFVPGPPYPGHPQKCNCDFMARLKDVTRQRG